MNFVSHEETFQKIVDNLIKEDLFITINGNEFIFKTSEFNDCLNFIKKNQIPFSFLDKFFRIIYEPFYKKNNIYLCFSDLIQMNARIFKYLSDHLPERDLSLYDGEIEYKAFFLYDEDEKIYNKSQNLSCPDFGNFIIDSIKSKTIKFDVVFFPVKFTFKNKNTVLNKKIEEATINLMKKWDFSHFTAIAVNYVYPEIKNTKFTIKMEPYDQKIFFIVHSILDFLNSLNNIDIKVVKGKITNQEIMDLFYLLKKDMLDSNEHIGCFCLLYLMFYADKENIFYNEEINKIQSEIFKKIDIK